MTKIYFYSDATAFNFYRANYGGNYFQPVSLDSCKFIGNTDVLSHEGEYYNYDPYDLPAPYYDDSTPFNSLDSYGTNTISKPIRGWAWVLWVVYNWDNSQSYATGDFEFDFNQDGTVPINLFNDNAPVGYSSLVEQSRIFALSSAVYEKIEKYCYIDLLSGYYLDDRLIPSNILITPTETKKITLSYYRENKLEKINKLRSIDWMQYTCNLEKDVNYTLPIVDCVLGTLFIDDVDFSQWLQSLPTSADYYPYSYLFNYRVNTIFNDWQILYSGEITNSNNTIIRTLRKLAANNDIWENGDLSNNLDISVNMAHPMFAINNQLTFDNHLSPQPNNLGIGNIIMDSPRTIEIHRALDAGKWGVNPDDPELPRLINLGWFIERIAWFFGIRPKPDGKIDTVKDKASVRQVIDKNKVLDPEKIGVNSFGEDGMVLTRINNRFKNKDIVSDQCVIVKDFIQIVQEYFEQTNLALGIQESSAIEIKRDKTTARFNNQLEILVELVNLMSSGNEMIRANLVSSLVTQSQSNEIIAGLGLPSVTKTIPLKMEDKIYHLPYKGIAAHRSISQEIATCTYNVGLVTGQLL